MTATPPVDTQVSALPTRVLFLCTQNAARSQIAEALLTKKGGNRFVVGSAGSAPAAVVNPGALAALRTAGIDWSGHRPKLIEAMLDQPWDIVITLCDRAREACPALPSRPVTAHWSIPDPNEMAGSDSVRAAAAFDDTLTLLTRRIDLMLALRPELLDRLVLEERLRGFGDEIDHHGTIASGTPMNPTIDPHGDTPHQGAP